MPGSSDAPVRKRADARRNERALLDAAAEVFVVAGVQAPVRDIAARAGVGMGTIYRHFPTRADLVVAVYRHQVDGCVQAGAELLAGEEPPATALAQWIDRFVDFLVTKHGLAAALRSDDADFSALHAYFLDRLVPVCDQLLQAAIAQHEIRSDVSAFELLFAVGNLCVGVDVGVGRGGDTGYDARRMARLLVDGLRTGEQRPARARDEAAR